MRSLATGTCLRLALASSGVLVMVMAMTSACSTDSPTAPGGGGSASNMITITATGADPQTVRIRVGERVVFTNDDFVDHDMSSDLHPTHTECPAVNQVGYLRPGETRETGNFVRAETCTFHDHIHPTNASLTGSITITE